MEGISDFDDRKKSKIEMKKNCVILFSKIKQLLYVFSRQNKRIHIFGYYILRKLSKLCEIM